MIPVRLVLKDFLSHRESVIDFEELDPVTLIIGVDRGDPNDSNGCGKSSIFDAITWVLYEKSRASGSKSTSLDSIVRQGTAKAEVEFQFLIGEDLYRIVRSRDLKKRQSDISFQVKSGSKWQSVAADTKKQTNAKIIQVIGIDYDLFVNSVLLEQGAATIFAHMTAGERKDLVSKILQLDHYDKYAESIKEKLVLIDAELESSDAFLQEHADIGELKLEAELALKTTKEQVKVKIKEIEAREKVIDKLRLTVSKEQESFDGKKGKIKQLEKFQEKVAILSRRMQATLKKLKEYEQKISALAKKLSEQKERVKTIKENRGDPSLLKRDLKTWGSQKETTDGQVTILVVKTETTGSEILRLNGEAGRVADLDDGQCNICYSKITEESKERVVEELNQKVESISAKHRKEQEQLRKIKLSNTEAKTKLTELEEMRSHFNKLNEEGRLLIDRIKTGREHLEEYEEALKDTADLKVQDAQELTTVQEEMSVCLDEIDKIGDISNEALQKAECELSKKVQDLDTERRVMMKLQVSTGRLEQQITEAEKIVKLVAKKRDARCDREKERRVHKELLRAFGRQGIQALIMENSAIEIEKIANDLLGKITDGRVKISIETQKENKDGTMKEVFDIIITDEYHSSPFVMYSGGEKFRIAFVIRIALSTLLARRSGVRISTIFYDEAFQDLDRRGVDKLIEIFTILAQDFKHQLVVTHQSELKSQFSDVLVVNKTDDGSVILK